MLFINCSNAALMSNSCLLCLLAMAILRPLYVTSVPVAARIVSTSIDENSLNPVEHRRLRRPSFTVPTLTFWTGSIFLFCCTKPMFAHRREPNVLRAGSRVGSVTTRAMRLCKGPVGARSSVPQSELGKASVYFGADRSTFEGTLHQNTS
jgi:hypothetical protein